MPIGYNPDIINPGGIDYAELTDLVNPPNAANAGKTIVIDESGKPTLGEGGGGGGGASVGVLYIIEADPPQTDPAIDEYIAEHPGTTFENTASPLSTTPDGEPMDYAALVGFFNKYGVVRLNQPSPPGTEGSIYPISRMSSNGVMDMGGDLILIATVETLQNDIFGVRFTGHGGQ